MIEVLYVGFNQDCGCFSVGTSNGFRVYSCDPQKEWFRREFNNGGIGIVEMLFRCNLLAIVGGGPSPKYSPNKVMIWDDHLERCIGELTFKSQVRAVKLRRDRIVVAQEHCVYVYNFSNLKVVKKFETRSNPMGLLAVSNTQSPMTLVAPGMEPGVVRLEVKEHHTQYIKAHESPLSCLALALDGRLLATASEKGTLVRVFSTANQQLLQEVRRGSDYARIFSVAFSRTCNCLAVSSDKGTVHVFSMNAAVMQVQEGGSPPPMPVAVQGTKPAQGEQRPAGVLGWVKQNILPTYFSSEWSFAQFRLAQPNDAPSAARSFPPSVVGFGAEDTRLFVVTKTGEYYCLEIDRQGPSVKQIAYDRFITDGPQQLSAKPPEQAPSGTLAYYQLPKEDLALTDEQQDALHVTEAPDTRPTAVPGLVMH